MAKRGTCVRCGRVRTLYRAAHCNTCVVRYDPPMPEGIGLPEERKGAEVRAPRVAEYVRQVDEHGRIVAWLPPADLD